MKNAVAERKAIGNLHILSQKDAFGILLRIVIQLKDSGFMALQFFSHWQIFNFEWLQNIQPLGFMFIKPNIKRT